MKAAVFLLSVTVRAVSGAHPQCVTFSPFTKAEEPPKSVTLLSIFSIIQ